LGVKSTFTKFVLEVTAVPAPATVAALQTVPSVTACDKELTAVAATNVKIIIFFIIYSSRRINNQDVELATACVSRFLASD
jgi:hypothetical protein